MFRPPAVDANVVQRVLDRQRYVLGPEVDAFEAAFARYCGTAHAVAVGNGTDALELALRALGIKRGDRVVLAANAGFYGSTAVRALGAEPVYVDVDPATLSLAPNALEASLMGRPNAILVTHLYGRLADMEAICALADRYGIPVVEDCAQAHGAAMGGRRAGSFGALGCFSFYPTKNLGALGDGGAVVTHDERVAQALRALRQYGWMGKYHVEMPYGRNSRLDEIQAAVLADRLPKLDAWNDRRRAIARRYNDAFAALPATCPAFSGPEYVAHLYVMRVGAREPFRHFLADHGVDTDVHYPVPDHRQPAWPDAGMIRLPVTEAACDQVVSLPCFPDMSDGEVEHVIDAVRRYFSEGEAGGC